MAPQGPPGAAVEVAKAAIAAGFKGAGTSVNDPVVIAVAISGAEADWQEHPEDNINGDGSRDRGSFQINSRAHPEVSDACAYSYACAARAAFTISAGGAVWTPWSVFNTGLYRAKLQEALQAVVAAEVLGGGPGNPGLPFPGDVGTQGLLGGLEKMALGIYGPVAGVIGSAGDLVGAVKGLGFALSFFSNPHNWLRLGMAVGGAVLIVLALLFLFQSTKTGQAVTATAGKAAMA